MQWRVLTLVLCGLVVMYITSLMQETSYPHPYSIYTSDPTRWRHKPDSMLLSTAAGYLYLTLFYYEAAPEGREGFRNGVGPMKTGVVGKVGCLLCSLEHVPDQEDMVIQGASFSYESHCMS